MYFHEHLVFLPWILPWSNAYIGLDSAPLSSHHIHPSYLSAQLRVTLKSHSPATFATENTTIIVPVIEKNQDPDTEKTEPADTKPQDTSPCPEQEDLECDECGGQKYDREEGLFRCLGVEEDHLKWKDCFCMGTRQIFPYEPQGPSPEEIAEDFRNLPVWTSDSWSRGPPPGMGLVGGASSGEVGSGEAGNEEGKQH